MALVLHLCKNTLTCQTFLQNTNVSLTRSTEDDFEVAQMGHFLFLWHVLLMLFTNQSQETRIQLNPLITQGSQ